MILKRALFFILLFLSVSDFYAAEPSLREKIGQMLIVDFQGTVIDAHSPIAIAIGKYNLGGVILSDFSIESQTYNKNIVNPEQVFKLNQTLQHLTRIFNVIHRRENLPLFISIDYEGGKVNRLKPAYGFQFIPSPKIIGTLPANGVAFYAKLMADILKTAGFNLDFFPTLDLDINSDNPIIGKPERSFSADPFIVAQDSQIYAQSFLNNDIECSYKHFPGHGSSFADSHLGFVDVTFSWQEEELIPYLLVLSQPKHCNIVMIAHIINRKLDISGLPSSLSYNVITGLLRHELNFDGVVITDDMQMRAITDNYGLETAVTLAINAGADMMIFVNQSALKYQDPKMIIDIIEKKVRSGEISERRINESYERIIKLKRGLGSYQAI